MYLDPAATRIYFSKFPTCQPFIHCMDDFIPTVESLMNEWLGRSLSAIEYQERRQTNWRGTIVLRHTPVIKLISLDVVDISLIQGNNITVVDELDPYSVYDGNMTIHTGNCDCSRFSYLIKYIAGYDPLPPLTQTIARMILQELLETGSPKSLFETPKEVTEVQNPSIGGTFKQRFNRGSASGTLLDRFMQPLARYKDFS